MSQSEWELGPQETGWGLLLVVQWLRLHVSNAGSPGVIPGQETRPHRLQLRSSTAKYIFKENKQRLVMNNQHSTKYPTCINTGKELNLQRHIFMQHHPVTNITWKCSGFHETKKKK